MVKKIKKEGKSKLNKLKKLLTLVFDHGIVKKIKKGGNIMTVKQQATEIIARALELSKKAEDSFYSFDEYKADNQLFKSEYKSGELFEDEPATPVEAYSFTAYLAYNYIKELDELEGF